MNIDVHFHYFPKKYLELISSKDNMFGDYWDQESETVITKTGMAFPVEKKFYEAEYIIEHMKEMKLDKVFLSISPTLFYYNCDIEIGKKVARLVNNSINEMTKKYPDKFFAMGSLPMQDVGAAMEELRYCVSLGFKAIQLGCSCNGMQYDNPKYLPLFREIEKQGIIVLFHPNCNLTDLLDNYYLSNIYGCPLETGLTASALIFGGVLDKFPKLKVVLVHGGGFIPYVMTRMKHGYEVRSEPKINGVQSPEKYLKNLYFDSLIFEQKQLKFLVDYVGADHVVIGTDHNFDMGMYNPVDFIKEVSFSEEDERKILSENLLALME